LNFSAGDVAKNATEFQSSGTEAVAHQKQEISRVMVSMVRVPFDSTAWRAVAVACILGISWPTLVNSVVFRESHSESLVMKNTAAVNIDSIPFGKFEQSLESWRLSNLMQPSRPFGVPSQQKSHAGLPNDVQQKDRTQLNKKS
jgi:hypothetical protein